jgi:alkylation response protein AidB-like acyl-CoA dehydrogenase
LSEVWDPERPLAEWRSILVDSGWGCPTWPVEWYGKGLPPAMARLVDEELAAAGAVGAATGGAMSMAAPTLLEHASDELKSRLLRPIATGEDRWCQLFSEPGSGSDLAGLTTRAERDGDEWVVTGQKLWNTGAGKAAYGMLLARTDFDAPKHRGLTYFVLPMRQPGVEVRPLKQMNGYASFTEVFLHEARVPAANMVAGIGDGWNVARTTLAHERGVDSGQFAPPPPRPGRTAREAAEEAAEYYKTYVWYPQRMGRVDLLLSQATATGGADDATIRQDLARVLSLHLIAGWTDERIRAARAAGNPPGAEGSIMKLLKSRIAREAAAVHGRMAGASAMLAGDSAPLDGTIAEVLISVSAQSIAGGTDEIQRNILGERMLGLPREPADAPETPFRLIRTNALR